MSSVSSDGGTKRYTLKSWKWCDNQLDWSSICVVEIRSNIFKNLCSFFCVPIARTTYFPRYSKLKACRLHGPMFYVYNKLINWCSVRTREKPDKSSFLSVLSKSCLRFLYTGSPPNLGRKNIASRNMNSNSIGFEIKINYSCDESM